MADASNSETPDRVEGAPPPVEGLERWLTTRGRLFVLAVLVAAVAAVATSLGELELQRASGIATPPMRVLGLSGALWLGWALLALPIFAVARRFARSGLPWLVTAFLHVAIGASIGAVFVAAEITIQELLQGPAETEAAAGAVDRIELEQRFRAMSPEEQAEYIENWRERFRGRRDRGPDRRGTERGPGSDDGPRGPGGPPGGAERRGGEAPVGDDSPGGARVDSTGAGGRFDPGSAPSPDDFGGPPPEDEGNRRNGRGGRDRQRGGGSVWEDAPPPPLDPTSPRAVFARVRTGTSVNLATGDFAADYQRRWLLRVPRYGLVYLALVGLGLGLRAYGLGRERERETAQLEVRAAALEHAVTEARLAALTGQLHPHFLFNALHSVGGLIRSERGPEALSALDAIGDLLRTSLDAGGEQFVPLARELELVRRYLAVEELRLGERLRVSVESDPGLAECEVPAFITQPLVENAVKHGVSPRPKGGAVRVRVHSENGDTLVVDIEDDGDGYEPTAGGRVGVGLAHVRDRLAALFEDAAALEFHPGENGRGTIARLRLPLDDAFEPGAPSR